MATTNVTLETTIWGRLLGAPAIVAFVYNTNVSSLIRIFPDSAPQGAPMPLITHQRVGATRYPTLSGPPAGGQLVEARVQLTCWADDPLELSELVDLVRIRLDGFTGQPNTNCYSVQATHLEDEAEIPGIEPGNEAAREYGRRLDFTFWYEEPMS